MMPIRRVAGRIALGAFPYAAMPAGKLKTPAPTMDLTKLNISTGMDAVPLPLLSGSAADSAASADADIWSWNNDDDSAFLFAVMVVDDGNVVDSGERSVLTLLLLIGE